jgi:hypothetical protein
MNLRRRLIGIASISLALSAPSLAQAAQQGTDFDYPELQVTPRASERIATEAARESSTRWLSFAPFQVSAAATLTAGIAQLANPDPGKDPQGVSGLAGTIVGGTWLVTTFALEAMYHPYASAEQDISGMPTKTPREQLVRERYAEEAIHSASRLAWRLKWLSVLTNLGSNLYMVTQAKSQTFSQVMDGVGAAFAFAPLVFRTHWQDVADEQESYKKRIYAPIASATVLREPGTNSVAPGAVLMMSF